MATNKPTTDKPTPVDPIASRREFLQGRAALRSLAGKAQQLAEAVTGSFEEASQPPRKPAERKVALLETSRQAMACNFQVQYHAADGPKATTPMLLALDLVEDLESQLTIYRDCSEVLDVNAHAAVEPVQLEQRLFQLFQLCEWLHEQTGGAFDITSGPLSRVWGFLNRTGRMPAEAEIAAALDCVGGQYVLLNETAQSVSFAKPGVEVNFNSIGKGYALDRVAEQLAEHDVHNYLWHGGRSSVLARGRNLADEHEAWTIGIRDPLTPEKYLAEIYLRDQALGTAGSATQYFEHDGKRYGHVIDPRTGWPAEGVYSATAVAPTAAEADALATAFYVLGPGGAAEYCAAHDEVSALVVCPGAGDSALDVHAFNLTNDQWTRC